MHFLSWKLKDNLIFRIIVCVLFCAVIGPLVTLHHLNKDSSRDFTVRSFQSRTKLDKTYGKDEFLLERLEELKREIKELEAIKLSLSNELRDLEGRRHIVQKNIQKLHDSAEKIQIESKNVKNLVNRAKRDLDVYKLERTKVNRCHLPELRLPKSPEMRPRKHEQLVSFDEISSCNLEKCFDFSQCSSGDGFSIYVYSPTDYGIGSDSHVDLSAVYDILKDSAYYTTIPTHACVYVVLMGSLNLFTGDIGGKALRQKLHSLPYWNSDGKNHFLLKLASLTSPTDRTNPSIDFGMAFVGQSSFIGPHYRPGFDVAIPPIIDIGLGEELWRRAAPQLPGFRKYFASFEGELTKEGRIHEGLSAKDLISLSKEMDDLYIFTECQGSSKRSHHQLGWSLCGEHGSRVDILKKSTYTLIPGPSDEFGPWETTHVRLIEAIQCGAVPVVLTTSSLLPFRDVIYWKQAAIILPSARITEINTLLRTITAQDLLKLRQQGRFLWENYLSSPKVILDTTLAVVRTRLSLPALPLLPTPSTSVFLDSNKPLKSAPDADAILELPIKSPTFTRNLTLTVSFTGQQWNSAPGALFSTPSSPFEPVLPSSAPFMNTTTDFEVIGEGRGGSGVPFSRSQGGNHPKEQFTVVILTYERETVLMESITRLVGLQYLNKVVVVWNSPHTPTPTLRWPDIGVPIHVLKTAKNSLNNRFIPYDIIDTDAILSIDDDVELRHDEILLAFRVWRENRDRIVGFPGRFHAWDEANKRWTYNSKYACELSLILTGAAFIHRYYFYLYTHWMPKPILNKVDEYMNCEDIAMNYLVSHITRKPPLKVTSRWTFLCSSCPVALWEDKSHFEERNDCLNFFAKVYGYMPLLRTQYRADSVLFKTRISSSESKCFKYV